MDQHDDVLDEEVLSRLEDRLKRGIPKWEQAHFIEQVVPLLVKKLRNYVRSEKLIRDPNKILRRHFR